MSSKGVQNRVFLSAPTMWAAFAYSEFVVEAGRRLFPLAEAQFHQRQREERDDEPRFISLAEYMRAVGHELGEIRDGMVAADRAVDRDRAAVGEAIRRRDELAKTVYKRVVWLRNRFEDRVGRRRTTNRLLVGKGETPRDPTALLQVGRRAAEQVLDPEVELPEPLPGEVISRRVVGESLVAECDAVAAAIEAIELQEAAVKGSISVREEAIAAFDEYRAKVGRFLERLLLLMQMPTLAATVRPELEVAGRTGRPAKKRPRDLFPDLVAAALALDPGAGLTIEEIRALVPRRPESYERVEDVPDLGKHLEALEREARRYRAGRPDRRPDEPGAGGAGVPNRLEPKVLGGRRIVDQLKRWLAGRGRTSTGREE